MTPFYFLDGPLQGLTILSDFRDLKFQDVTYRKTTFAGIYRNQRLFCDVAYCGRVPDILPPEAHNNIVQDTVKMQIPREVTISLREVSSGGRIKEHLVK